MATGQVDTDALYIFPQPQRYRFVGTAHREALHIIRARHIHEAVVAAVQGEEVSTLCGARLIPRHTSTMKLQGDTVCAGCWELLADEDAPRKVEMR